MSIFNWKFFSSGSGVIGDGNVHRRRAAVFRNHNTDGLNATDDDLRYLRTSNPICSIRRNLHRFARLLSGAQSHSRIWWMRNSWRWRFVQQYVIWNSKRRVSLTTLTYNWMHCSSILRAVRSERCGACRTCAICDLEPFHTHVVELLSVCSIQLGICIQHAACRCSLAFNTSDNREYISYFLLPVANETFLQQTSGASRTLEKQEAKPQTTQSNSTNANWDSHAIRSWRNTFAYAPIYYNMYEQFNVLCFVPTACRRQH